MPSHDVHRERVQEVFHGHGWTSRQMPDGRLILSPPRPEHKFINLDFIDDYIPTAYLELCIGGTGIGIEEF